MTLAPRSRVAALAAALAVALSACSGPKLPLEVFVKEDPVDITFGEQSPPTTVPARPAGAEVLNPGFPSFIAPPPPKVRTTATTGPATTGTPPTTTRPLPPCPAPDPFQTPETTSSNVGRPPTEGVYTYRREGVARVAGTAVVLSPIAKRSVQEVITVQTPRGAVWRYVVKQTEASPGAALSGATETETETAYEIDPNGGTQPYPVVDTERVAGIKIVGIATKSSDGTDVFQPQPPVRFITLPASQKSYYEGSGGTDPLTGLALDVRFQTLERAEVEACGTVYQAWKQRVEGVYYDAANPPDAGGGRLWFTSTLWIANHLGGLILKDELHLSDQAPKDRAATVWDIPPGTDIDIVSTSTINSVTPGRLP